MRVAPSTTCSEFEFLLRGIFPFSSLCPQSIDEKKKKKKNQPATKKSITYCDTFLSDQNNYKC